MADYYSILKKTISGLAHNSPGTRIAVYNKARSAIDRQLRAIEPTPSEEAIVRQMQLLEVAIERLDSEFVTPVEPKPLDPQPSDDAQSIGSADMAPRPTAQATSSNYPVSEEVSVDTPVGAGTTGYVPAGTAVKSPTSAPQIPAVQEPASVDPHGMDYSETILAAEPDTLGKPQGRPRGKGAAKPRNNGIMSTLLPIVLAIGVIGGGLYALWINKEALLNGLIGDDKQPIAQSSENNGSGEVEVSSNTAINETENSAQSEPRDIRVIGDDNVLKNSTKLTPDGETVEVEPEQPVVEPPVDTGQNDTIAEPEAADNTATPAPSDDSTQQVTEVGEDGQPATNTNETSDGIKETAQSSGQDTQPAQPSNVAPAVAQKAFLYEEGTSGSDASRDNAAIIWSLGEEVIEGGALEAVIKGQLDVPGRSLSMSIVIKRNRDDSLPASHIIELVFQIPKDFGGGNISNVSRIVMKSSEQGRGEGLIAVPAKISDGNFLIALNNLEQALVTNRKLLLESSWIDVPLGYTTGRRALVTLEKGALGDKVFRDAFANWDRH